MLPLWNPIFKKNKSFVAIDIGTSRIKLVEIKVKGKNAFINSLSSCPTPEGAFSGGIQVEQLASAVKEAVKSAGLCCKEIVTSIGNGRIVATIVRMPKMPAGELDKAVRWEAEKYIPVPVEDTVLRYVKLNESTVDGSRQFNILLAAVPKETVYCYIEIFARAGLEVAAIDIQAFALWRAFIRNINGAGSVAVVDLGKQSAHIVISERGSIRYAGSLPMVEGEAGKHEYTRVDQLNEDYFLFGNANPVKREGNWSGAGKLDWLFSGLKSSLDVYILENRESKIEKIILTGGLSKLEGIAPHLSARLQLPVELGFPEIPVSESRGLQEPIDPAFSVAVGLAMREVPAGVQS